MITLILIKNTLHILTILIQFYIDTQCHTYNKLYWQDFLEDIEQDKKTLQVLCNSKNFGKEI